jgi:hypothetical protein
MFKILLSFIFRYSVGCITFIIASQWTDPFIIIKCPSLSCNTVFYLISTLIQFSLLLWYLYDLGYGFFCWVFFCVCVILEFELKASLLFYHLSHSTSLHYFFNHTNMVFLASYMVLYSRNFVTYQILLKYL